MVITKDLKLWIGNERAEPLRLDPMPLYGFGLGDFEDKVLAGQQLAFEIVGVVQLSTFWLGG